MATITEVQEKLDKMANWVRSDFMVFSNKPFRRIIVRRMNAFHVLEWIYFMKYICHVQ